MFLDRSLRQLWQVVGAATSRPAKNGFYIDSFKSLYTRTHHISRDCETHNLVATPSKGPTSHNPCNVKLDDLEADWDEEEDPYNHPYLPPVEFNVSYQPKNEPTPISPPDHLSKISESIESVVRSQVNPKASVHLFGSAINGLWTTSSDVDICVRIPNVVSRSGIIRNLRRISNVIAPIFPSTNIENRFNAKVPLLHLSGAIPEAWDNEDLRDCPSDPSYRNIDICVNNDLAIENSSLIGAYVACDPRVKSLIQRVKLWAKSRGINDRFKGTLGSFALSLMVIHFLQRVEPPILTSLQDLAYTTNEPPKYVSGVDCRYTSSLEVIEREMEYVVGERGPNRDSVDKLLTNFFKYFGYTYMRHPDRPICIRSIQDGLIESARVGRGLGFLDGYKAIREGMEEERFMHVDNPFEVGIDVANVGVSQRGRIVAEMRRAYRGAVRWGNEPRSEASWQITSLASDQQTDPELT